MKRLSIVLVTMLCVSLAGTAPVFAQGEVVLTGAVTDETGGALPGVTVTATHTASGFTAFSVTDGTGVYRIGGLRAGGYSAAAALSGFATLVQEDIGLAVGDVATLNFDLEIATVAETVTVTGVAPLIDTATSSMGGSITPLEMEALPINGRDWLQLSMMAPGSRVNATASSLSPSGRWATDFQINLDGQPVSQSYSVASLGQPRFSRDAIAEFEVVSSRFDATQGRSTGIQINAVTKSGTNAMSGTVSGFFRHDAMNAPDHIADKVLPYQNQQFSVTVGGPIKQDRIHFFGYFENESEPQSFYFDSIIPEWNALGNGSDGLGLQDTFKSRLYGGRVDGQLTDNTRLMGRFNGWIYDTLHRPERSLASHPSSLMDKDFTSFQAFMSLTRASGQSVNELKIGYNNFVWDNQSYWGIRSPEVRLQGVAIGPSFVTNGSNQTQDIISLRDDYTSLRGNHTLKMGGEYIIPSYYVYVPAERDGVLYARNGPPPANVASLFPSIDPSTWNLGPLSSITERWAQTSGRYDAHSATCDNPGAAPGVRDPDNGCYRKKPTYSFWFQDDFQASDNLTLNLGIRWDYAEDIMANDIDYTNLRAPQYANDPVRTGAPQETKLFQPRLGFAYSLNEDRTVIRGGWGIYYSGMNDVSAIHTEFPLSFLTFENVYDGRADFASNPFGHLPGGLQPTHQEVIDGANAGTYRLDLSSYGPITMDDARIPYSHQTTFGFQQQIGDTASFQMDWVRIDTSRGRYPHNANLTYSASYNGGANLPYSVFANRRWPDLGLVRHYDHGKEATYNGIEMALTKRYSDGFQFTGTYTIGKARACSPSPFGVRGAHPVPRDLGEDCWNNSVSDGGPADQRHRMVLNSIVDLPGDLQFSTVFMYGSGQRYDSYNPYNLRDIGGMVTGWVSGGQRLEHDGTIIDHAAVKGTAINRIDIRLMRRFDVGRVQLDGIFEVFNVFNYENYGNFQGCTCASSYGNPRYNSDVAYWPRVMQLAFRVGF